MHSLKCTVAPLESTPQPITTSSQSPSRATIENLSDKLLLKIFCYYLDASPRFWPMLGHICRRWRHIVLVSFRLYFTHGTPVSKSLECRPALPIVVQYGGSPGLDPPAPEDEDNILTALQQSNRVISISLTVTSSLLEKLSAIIKKPFSELEDLVLRSQDDVPLTLPSSFQCGARLHSLHLTAISPPAPLQLLRSSRNLVDLQLHKVLNPQLFSPKVLATLLSGMAQLRSLSLHFLPTAKIRVPAPPPWKRAVLPVLTHFNFRGNTEYLEDLVTEIDAPRLGHIKVASSNIQALGLSKLSEFIGRIKLHKAHHRAHILSSERAISISLIRPGAPICLKLQLFCQTLSLQLSSMARICIQFSAFLLNVEDLRISVTRQSRREDSLDRGRWLGPLDLFRGVKWLHVVGNLSTDIVRALQLPDDKAVLPALQGLYIPQPWSRHAFLSEAVVSFMTSRRRSGHPIAVKSGRLRHESELCGEEGHFSQQVTSEVLYDDILLNIFRHYLDVFPRFWPTLGCVCQRWRQIVLTSPLGLNLRLYCTPGAPVLKTLDFWPNLPIIVEYGGLPNLDPPAPEDDDNIIAALKQSGRVSSISLTVTSSLLDKLSAISEPFSELETLALLSQDNMRLALPSTFRWGPRLRTFQSTRIAFLSFPELLLPCQDLVDLQLHEIPGAGYFSPEAFANALSGMTQLRTLSFHFLSFPRRRSFLSLPPPPGERILLPALTRLQYRGISKYLDSLAARIDAPHLENIDITFYSQPTMDALQLGRFIERTEMQTSLIRAEVQVSAHTISTFFTDPSTSTPLRLQISCKQLDWQLSCMAQVCDQFSPFLVRVEELSINTTQESSGQDSVDGEEWLDLVLPFGGAKDFHMADELATKILRALPPADGSNATALPALRHFRVEGSMATNEPLWDAFQSSRRLSGHPIELQVLCYICNNSFAQLQEFKTHLVGKHAHRVVCTYCGEFECKPGQRDLFMQHLRNKHLEVARNDGLASSRVIYAPELRRLVDQHTSLRAPDIITPSTTTPASPPSVFRHDTDEKFPEALRQPRHPTRAHPPPLSRTFGT